MIKFKMAAIRDTRLSEYGREINQQPRTHYIYRDADEYAKLTTRPRGIVRRFLTVTKKHWGPHNIQTPATSPDRMPQIRHIATEEEVRNSYVWASAIVPTDFGWIAYETTKMPFCP